jgi:hypothetical protein
MQVYNGIIIDTVKPQVAEMAQGGETFQLALYD